jgi:dihydrofolate reductase
MTMAILTVTTFVTLDGVMQAPGALKEDPSGGFTHGGWLFPHADAEFGAFMTEVFTRPTAFLLGRRTYEIFASYWPKMTDPKDPIATKLNGLPKYVASRTLAKAEWNATTIIEDVVPAVTKLKKELSGELQVHGSADLIQTLIQNGLVDEFNVVTAPIVLGAGKRLFGAGSVPAALKLKSSKATTTGVVLSVYASAGKPVYGSFEAG